MEWGGNINFKLCRVFPVLQSFYLLYQDDIVIYLHCLPSDKICDKS